MSGRFASFSLAFDSRIRTLRRASSALIPAMLRKQSSIRTRSSACPLPEKGPVVGHEVGHKQLDNLCCGWGWRA